jgi:hypothetical protein
MKSIFTTVFMSTLIICSTSTFAKEYYKWVDSKGSTHYTTTPPPKTAKKHGKIDTYGYYNSTPTPAPAATNTTTQTTQQNQQGTQPAPATTAAQQVPVNNVNQPANTVNENNALKEESRLVDK